MGTLLASGLILFLMCYGSARLVDDVYKAILRRKK